jgi:predicted nucleotidyltransferase
MNAEEIAEKGLLFYTLSGSHAYGTSRPESDKDWRGIFVLPQPIYRSAFQTIEILETFRQEKDAVVYELKKFVKLLVDQNPNIMELLWAPDDCIQLVHNDFKPLFENRDLFISKKAKFTFSGYAHSQLQRIKGHNKWINNPQPKRRPKEIDFVSVVWNNTNVVNWNKEVPFKDFKAYLLGGETYGLVYSGGDIWHDIHEALVIQEGSMSGKTPSLIVKFNKQLYKEHVENWKHYWEWVKNRNVVRSEFEQKYGYDTKHASHLIRLLRMGHEILKEEGVLVRRPDAQNLLDIRNGKYTYEEIIKEAEELDKELDNLYETSKLRHSVDTTEADRLKDIIYDNYWQRTASPTK